jgi:hypothetical protein
MMKSLSINLQRKPPVCVTIFFQRISISDHLREFQIYFRDPKPKISCLVVYQHSRKAEKKEPQRKSRWNQEVPDLDLNALYQRVKDILAIAIRKKNEEESQQRALQNLLATSNEYYPQPETQYQPPIGDYRSHQTNHSRDSNLRPQDPGPMKIKPRMDHFTGNSYAQAPAYTMRDESNSFHDKKGTELLQSLNVVGGSGNGYGSSSNYNPMGMTTGFGGSLGGGLMDGVPPSLKEFLVKAYERCSGAREEEIMTQKLKDIVGTAKNQGCLNTIDWKCYPVPVLAKEKRNNSVLKIERVERKNSGPRDEDDSHNRFVYPLIQLNKIPRAASIPIQTTIINQITTRIKITITCQTDNIKISRNNRPLLQS